MTTHAENKQNKCVYQIMLQTKINIDSQFFFQLIINEFAGSPEEAANPIKDLIAEFQQ